MILRVPAEGKKIVDALDLIGEAFGNEAVDVVAVPVGRLPDEFFELRSGILGEMAQKFVNYRLRLVIVGDISEHVARSDALRDFVYETNRGNQLWFVADAAELERRLNPH